MHLGATSNSIKAQLSGRFFSVNNQACAGQENNLAECSFNKMESDCNSTYPWIQCNPGETYFCKTSKFIL